MHVSQRNVLKLNIGGRLFQTTLSTLSREDNMLKAMFTGNLKATSDSDGFVFIDRSGKYFDYILDYLRDGSVSLPNSRFEVDQILQEASYYCIEGLITECENWKDHMPESSIIFNSHPDVKSDKPIIKLLYNLHNNNLNLSQPSAVFLLKNLELYDKLVGQYNRQILFLKEISSLPDQQCQWLFYKQNELFSKIDCTGPNTYNKDIRFPEGKIYETAMQLLLCRIKRSRRNSLTLTPYHTFFGVAFASACIIYVTHVI